jgi:choline dehydrogenase
VSGGFLGLVDPTLSFRFPSVPQAGLNGRTIDVVGGVMLGGSSGVNGMQVHRGQKADYDRWADYFDRRSSWNWDSLLPYFKKVSICIRLDFAQARMVYTSWTRH